MLLAAIFFLFELAVAFFIFIFIPWRIFRWLVRKATR
jgi:hypothetical protein